MTLPIVKISWKIGIFIPNFRLRRTPGLGEINDFTNKKIFLHKEAYAQNNKLYIKMPSSAWYDLPICQKFKKTDFGRNLPGGLLRHSTVSQMVRMDFKPENINNRRFFLYRVLTHLLVTFLTSYSKPTVFWKNALQVRKALGPKLGFQGCLDLNS